VVGATRSLAWAYHRGGELDRARELHEANLGEIRARGFVEREAGTLGSLAMIAFDQARHNDADVLARQSLIAAQEVGSLGLIAQSVCRVAQNLAFRGDSVTAARLLGWFEAQNDQIGVGEPWVARMNERTIAVIKAQLDDAAFAEAWEEGRKLTLDAAAVQALDALGEAQTRPAASV
jgi:hypothetical protein